MCNIAKTEKLESKKAKTNENLKDTNSSFLRINRMLSHSEDMC